MAIGVNSSVARADLAATTTTTTITKPTGTVNTDVLVVVFGTDQSGTPGSITPPAGWTAIFTNVLVTVGSTGVRLSGFWALGSVANLGFTNSSTGDQQGWVCRGFTGVDNTTPVDVVDNTGTGHNTGSASLTVNSVTIATANAWELIAFASWLGGTNSATGFTATQNVTSPPATNADATLLHNATPKGTGATGTVVVTSSAAASGQILIGVPFALRDAGAPPTPAVSLLASTFVTTAATSYTTASATPTGNNLLVAVCAVTGSVATDWAVTDSLGGAWTKVTASRAQKGTNVDEMEVWVRNALTSSALTVTYSHATGSTTGGGLVVLQVTNMTRTGASAVRGAGVQNNLALGTAPTPVLPATTLTANPTLWAVFNATALASTPLTDPTGWTRRANLSYATPTTGIQVATRDSGFVGTTITGGSNSGSAYCSLGLELDASTAGNNFTKSLTGAMTSSGGTISRAPRKPLAGSVSSAGSVPSKAISRPSLVGAVAPSGSLSRLFPRSLLGSISPSGAAVTLSKVKVLNLAGSVAAAGGSIVRALARTLAGGSASPTGAAVAKRTVRGLAGSTTPTGAISKLLARASFGGAMAGSGALAKRAAKSSAGAMTSAGAAISRRVLKSLSGAATPSGAYGAAKFKLLNLAGGSVTAAGTFARGVVKPMVGGAAVVSGLLAKRLLRTMTAGGTTPSGSAVTFIKTKLLSLSGTVTTAGASLVRRVGKPLVGGVGPTGATTRRTSRTLSGAAATTGSLARQVDRTLTGAAAGVGMLARSTARVLAAGAVVPTGGLAKLLLTSMFGGTTPDGSFSLTKIPAGGGSAARFFFNLLLRRRG